MLLHQNQEVSDGVNLFISILISYPEIGIISIKPDNDTIQMNFMLSPCPPDADIEKLKHTLADSSRAYCHLHGVSPHIIDIFLNRHAAIAKLTVERDIATLSKGELGLMVMLLRDIFKASLLVDENELLTDDELQEQADMIDNMLQNVKGQSYDKLVGIREDGRVLVYNQ